MFDSRGATLSRPSDAVTGAVLASPPTAEPALAEQSLDDLADDLRTWAGHIAAAEAHWLGLVAEFCRRDGHLAWGLASPAHWLAWQCSLSPGTAREHVRVACALTDLPVTLAHFAAGRISYSKVRAITRIADPTNERTLVRLALNGTAVQVEKAVAGWISALNRDDPDNMAAREERWGVTRRYNEYGNAVITIEVAAEHSDRAIDGIDAWLDHVPDEPGPFDDDGLDTDASADAGNAPPPRATLARRRADAFLALIDTNSGARHGADRVRASIDVDLAVLSTNADGTCQVRNGPVIAAETARRLTCDAELEIFHIPAPVGGSSTVAHEGAGACTCGADGSAVDRSGRTGAGGGNTRNDGHRADAGGHGDDASAGPIELMEADHLTAEDAVALAAAIPDLVPVPEASRVGRTINRAARRAVARRDKGCCQFPGCTNTTFTEIHHIVHWACGGDHSLTNLTTLCHLHHRCVHEGGFRIAGDGNAPVFLRPDDTPMTVAPVEGDAGTVDRLGMALDIGPTTLSRGCGDRLQLDYTVAVLAELHPDTKVRSGVPAGTPRTGVTMCTRRPDTATGTASGAPPQR